jgi:hyperosmotically inducible protein
VVSDAALAERVRHELAMLPYYGVFDSLQYGVKDGVVTLQGQVTRPALRNSAARTIERVAGVDNVDNQIEVLPPSNFDDRIRWSVLRAVYGQPQLNKYAHVNPPIRILVKNGVVTLDGVVLNEGDRIIAGMQANSISGVFQVVNNLRVENQRPS